MTIVNTTIRSGAGQVDYSFIIGTAPCVWFLLYICLPLLLGIGVPKAHYYITGDYIDYVQLVKNTRFISRAVLALSAPIFVIGVWYESSLVMRRGGRSVDIIRALLKTAALLFTIGFVGSCALRYLHGFPDALIIICYEIEYYALNGLGIAMCAFLVLHFLEIESRILAASAVVTIIMIVSSLVWRAVTGSTVIIHLVSLLNNPPGEVMILTSAIIRVTMPLCILCLWYARRRL